MARKKLNKEEQDQLRTKKAKELMISTLTQTLGIVQQASDISGIPRASHYRWMKSDPDYKKQVNEISAIPLDRAEYQLLKQIEGGNITAIIFYLKTKGKDRGYVERREHAGVPGQPLYTPPEDATQEELMKELNDLNKTLNFGDN